MTIEQAEKHLRDIREEQAAKISGLPPLMRERTSLNSIVQALDMALDALREKAERENPRPLTLEELRQMEDKPFYVRMLDPITIKMQNIYFPAISDNFKNEDVAIWCGDEGSFLNFKNYGKTWTAYRHKPKEVPW